MPPHFRRGAARGNEYPVLVDRIFAGWYEPVVDAVQIVSASPAFAPPISTQRPAHVANLRTPAKDQPHSADVPTSDNSDLVFHVGDPLPCEVEELARLGVSEDRIAEMWGRFSPARIAKILGATVSQVRVAAAWSRRIIPAPVVRTPEPAQPLLATCAQCGTSHASQLRSLDDQPVCSEVCQIELNARYEAEHALHPELTQTTTIISGSLNADIVRELLVPVQNRLPRDSAVSSRSV